MTSSSSKLNMPQDVVAIFHASFHPTQGNIIDWSMKASDDVHLEGVEFSSLPSGLHLVEQDVVYFTKDTHKGVCVFRRRHTTEQGHRGFRLSSLGILLAKSSRPRPWHHIPALKALVNEIYESLEAREVLEPRTEDWEPARKFFEERKVRLPDLSGTGKWKQWSEELGSADGKSPSPSSNPALHLPHLLRILGPSCLTLYKHILGRRRILIYTIPPVEAACILCQVAADMCYEDQIESDSPIDAQNNLGVLNTTRARVAGKHKEGVKVLGIVTLHDLDKMDRESKSGLGWIACTSDAIFLERPQYYDLIIDLSTPSPAKASRPSLFVSRPQTPMSSRGPTHRLSSVRFTWSDVKLWTELDRLLQLDAGCSSAEEHDHCATTSPPPSAWSEVWRVYEDVCVLCAGLWTGSYRGPSGDVRLEGADDVNLGSIRPRNGRSGNEGRPMPGAFRDPPAPPTTSKAMRRSSGMPLWPKGGKGARPETVTVSPVPPAKDGHCDDEDDVLVEDVTAVQERQMLTTLALLQTFHAHTGFLLSRLTTLLPPPEERVGPVILSPKDVTSFELGAFSSLDARFIEWLAAEYGGGVQVAVRRSWRDLLGHVLGFGGS